MKKICFWWWAFCLAPLLLPAQHLAVAVPEAAGISSTRLARIDTVVEAFVSSERIPGAVAMVIKDGRTVLQRAYGWEDIEAREPMQVNSLFRLASMTKAITSVAVMMLYEEGHFLLDDPLHRWLPEYREMQVAVDLRRFGPDSTVAARRPVTIRQLLSHTAGLVYHWDNAIGKRFVEDGIAMGLRQENFSTAEGISRLADYPLLFEPGSQWHYGLNTDVLGRLVEVISGQPLDVFFRKRIFEPLEMHNTWFHVPDTARHRLTAVYEAQPDLSLARSPAGNLLRNGVTPYSIDYAYQDEAPRYLSGGAGLVGTTADYARFLQMLLNGGELEGARLLSRRSVDLMLRNHLRDLPYKPGKGFGLGFEVITDPEMAGEMGSAGEFRWGGFFSTHFWVDRETNMVMLMMLQMHPDKGLRLPRIFRNLCYQALE